MQQHHCNGCGTDHGYGIDDADYVERDNKVAGENKNVDNDANEDRIM